MPRISSTTAVKQPSVVNHRARSKPAWSDYLTEDNRFALTKAEVLRRKKTLLSKNNIFKSVSKTSLGTSNHQNNQPKRDVKSQRFDKANMRSDSLSSCVDDDDDVRSQALDALDFVAKKSICWEDEDADEDDDELDDDFEKENEKTILIGMTPSPERNEASGMLNKKSNNLNSVERTAEKYSGFYNMGKNVRTTKNANTNNRNDEEEDANENDNENDTDDEFEIGVLNLSNHDINDDDEVLQGVSYLTPPSRSRTHTKYTPKNSTKNTLNGAKNGTKNSTKIPNKTLTPKGSGFAENKSTVNVQYKQNYLSMKTVKTPVKRFLIEKREGSDRKEKLNEKLFDGKYDGKSDGKNGVTCVFMDGVRSDEMAEMTAQIKALTSELKYFEELTGRRCIYETKELQTALDSCSDANEIDGTQNLNSIAVMRYLVQLVCQSMTFLLRGEVEAHALRSKYDQLEIKVETLTKLLLPNNNNNNNNDYNNIQTSTRTHNPLYGINGLGSEGENGTGTDGGINPNFSSLSNYTPSLTTTGQQGSAYEFCPHSVSDLNSTYMSAYISYIKADSAHSGINGPESQKFQGYGSDKKDVNGVAKSQHRSNMTDNNTHYQPYQTLNNNQQIRQGMPYTPLPLSPPLYPSPSSKTAPDIHDKYTHTNTHDNTYATTNPNTNNKTNTNTNNNTKTNTMAHANTNNNPNTYTNNGESNPGPTSGTSTSDWLFACTPHKSPITPTTTTTTTTRATNGGQNPGVNAPQKNIFSPLSTTNYPSSTQKPNLKSECNVVNLMYLNGGNTKESLGSVKFEYESPSVSYTAENVLQTAEGGLSLQRRLFSQPSHFTLPSSSPVVQDVSSTSSLLPLPSSHHSSNPSSHPYTHTNTHTLSHTLSNPLPYSHPLPLSHTNPNTNMNTHTPSITHSTSSTLTKNTESVYDSTSQIHGNTSIKPYTDTRAVITKNLAQSFLDVDASLTQIENTRNGYSTYGTKGGEYNMGEKENKFAFNRNTSDKGSYYDGIQVLDPYGHGQHVSPYRTTQPLVLTSMHTDTYTAPIPLAGYKGSTGAGGYPLDTPPPPPPTSVPASDLHKDDGRKQSEKSKAHMSSNSSGAREGTHIPQGVYPPNPHSNYTASPRQASTPSTKATTAPSSSRTRAPTSAFASAPPHSRSQSPSPTPTPTTSHRPSSHTVPHQRSSITTSTSSSSSTHRHTAVSTDNEQGSMCVPSSHVPLPSAPPNHPFSLKKFENPLLNSSTSGSNKPIYDARHGSFSRK